jgi:glycosyltransferase involved in cell wall biosynthesis
MNPRMVKDADTLAEAGYDVSVIAPTFSRQATEADRVFADCAWRIVASPQFGPEAPTLIRIRELMRRQAARILVERFGLDNPAIVRAAWHSVTPDLVAAAKGVKADFYIAHLVAALPAAAIAAATNRVPFAFDAEDFHLGDPPDGPAYDVVRHMTRAIEGSYLPKCAYVTAAAPRIADAYVNAYGIPRPTVVLNAFPRSNAPPRPTARGTAIGPSVYWFSQTIGPDRGLECALRAIARARTRPHLYLRGTPAAGYIEKLRNLALQGGIGDRLHILPPGSPSEMERLASIHDVGLAGEIGLTVNRRIALTNKLFTYLLAGLPIVASAIPSQADFAKDVPEAVRLYPVDDHEGLATALDALLDDETALSAARFAAYSYGQNRYNWDVEKLILIDTVRAALSRPRANSELSRR